MHSHMIQLLPYMTESCVSLNLSSHFPKAVTPLGLTEVMRLSDELHQATWVKEMMEGKVVTGIANLPENATSSC